MKKSLVILLAAAAAVMGADDAQKPNPLKTHTELGFVQTSGNTDTTSFSLDFMGNKAWGTQSVKLDVNALYGTQNGLETNNKIVGILNYYWQFEKRLALNYIVGYKDDKFSGYTYQFYTGPGAKYDMLGSKKYKLDFQGNVLYNIQQEMNKYYSDANLTNEVKYPYPNGTAGLYEVDGTYTDYWGYLVGLDFTWVIVEGFKFIQVATYRGSMDDDQNYFVYSKTAVESKINSIFSMGLSYKVNYANTPPAGNDRTDTTTMASLIIDY